MASGAEMLLERVRAATEDEYTIEGELGRGGMAAVFLARDKALDRRVAIKVMLPDLVDVEGIQDRFVIEAKTAAKLDHPGIVTVYSVKQRAGLLCIVMKFIEGRTVDSILESNHKLEQSVVTTVGARVSEALHYAHGEGIVHRDIKPSNILIDLKGRPVVTDFGIAKVMSARSITVTGSVLGTPTYMSPEQCRGLPATAASDQYSLGVMLYEMLSGSVPFKGSIFELIHAHCDETPKPLPELVSDLDPALSETVMQMMAKKPADRFPSLAEVTKKLSASAPKRRLSSEVSDTIAAFARPTGAPVRRTDSDVSGAATELATTPAPGLVVTPADPSLEIGQTLVMRVSEQSGASLAGLRIVWRSEDPTVATVDDIGVVTGRTAGFAKITAAAGPSMGRANVTVRSAAVDTLVVTPQNREIATEGQLQFFATALDSRGSTLAGQQIVWQSSNVSVCAVSREGLAIGIAPGEATIAAACGKVKGEAHIRVRLPAVERVVVTPNDPSIEVEETRRLTVAVFGAEERVLTGRAVAWRSNTPSIATVDAEGTLKGIAAGSAAVIATCEGKEGLVSVTVRAQPVVAVRIQPAQLKLEVGRSLQLKGVGEDRRGRAVSGAIDWRSDDDHVAVIDASGKVYAANVGRTTVRAGVGEASSTIEVTVVPRAVAQLRIEPHQPKVAVGDFISLDVVVLDAEGGALTGRTVTWTSDDTSVLNVNATGACEARKPGAARITAACDGVRATTKLSVAAAVVGADAATVVVERAPAPVRDAAGVGAGVAAGAGARAAGAAAPDRPAQPARPQSVPPSVAEPTKRGGNRGLMIGGGVVVVAAIVVAMIMKGNKAPANSVASDPPPAGVAPSGGGQGTTNPPVASGSPTTQSGGAGGATTPQKQAAPESKQATPEQKQVVQKQPTTTPTNPGSKVAEGRQGEQKQAEQKQATPPETKQTPPPEQKQAVIPPPEQKQETKAPPPETKAPPPETKAPVTATDPTADAAHAPFCTNSATPARTLTDALGSDPAAVVRSRYIAKDANDGKAKTQLLDWLKDAANVRSKVTPIKAEAAGTACEWLMRVELSSRNNFGGTKNYNFDLHAQIELVGGVPAIKEVFSAVKR